MTDGNKGPTLTHPQAVNRLQEIQTELEELAQYDNPTPDDETRFNDLTVEYREVDQHRKHLERETKLAEVREAAKGLGSLKVERGTYAPPASTLNDYDRDAILNPDSVEDHRFKNPWDLSELRTFGKSPSEVSTELRARALDAITKMAGASTSVREASTNILEQFDSMDSKIARHILLTSSPAYLRGFSKIAKDKKEELTDEEQRAVSQVREFRAMSLTDAAGGYLIPFQLDPTVIITSNGSRNDIRQVARQVVATGDVWNGVSAASVSWSWDAEAAEVSDDAPTFAQPTVPVYKAAGFVPISIEAYEDAENVTQEIGRLLAFGKDELESAALATGTGSGQPTGIITALAGTSSEINAAADDTFAIADVFTIQGALPARYRANASWLANNAIYNLIRRFDTAGGAGMWERIGADRPALLLGRPALESEGMDSSVTTTGAVSNFILVFGDFSNYVIADRIGTTVEFIPHLVGANRRPTGQRGWYAYTRMGADSVNDGAFRLLDVPSAA